MDVLALTGGIEEQVDAAFEHDDAMLLVDALEKIAEAYQESSYSDIGKFMRAKLIADNSEDLVSYRPSWVDPAEYVVVLDVGRMKGVSGERQEELLSQLKPSFSREGKQFYVNLTTRCLGMYLS